MPEDPPLKIISSSLEKYLGEYKREYPEVDKLSAWKFSEVYNVQRYKPKEGYYKPHCEVVGMNGKENRVLVWMYYLNAVSYTHLTLPTKRIV